MAEALTEQAAAELSAGMPQQGQSGWLSDIWTGVSNFAVETAQGAAAAAVVIWETPGHAAAIVIDGLEQGASNVVGLVVGGVPDLIDFGAEKLFNTNLYDGSVMNAVSGGVKWGIDGIEGLVGITQPEINGKGDQFLFGAATFTGEVLTGWAALSYAQQLVSAGQSVLGGAWWVASHPLKTAAAINTAVTATAVVTVAGVGVDCGLNQCGITGAVTGAAVDKGVELVTGYEDIGDMWTNVVPQGVQDGLHDFMVFMGGNPALAKWGSFAMAMVASNSLIGMFAGESFGAQIATLAISGLIAWGLSEKFASSAIATYNEENGVTPPSAEDRETVTRAVATAPALLPPPVPA